MAESDKVFRPKRKRPWVLKIHYPERALWMRSLRLAEEKRPRFVQVKGIRMRSGGPDYGHVEVYVAKKKDGSCAHLCGGKCSIYARRPRACKAWFCGRGTDADHAWQELCRVERELRAPKRSDAEYADIVKPIGE